MTTCGQVVHSDVASTGKGQWEINNSAQRTESESPPPDLFTCQCSLECLTLKRLDELGTERTIQQNTGWKTLIRASILPRFWQRGKRGLHKPVECCLCDTSQRGSIVSTLVHKIVSSCLLLSALISRCPGAAVLNVLPICNEMR
jgi:hypothetical protein